MNIEKYNFTSSLNLNRDNNTALVFASYQPNKISSDILRVALDSLEKINLANISVWVIDVGSPKSDYLVKQNEFKILILYMLIILLLVGNEHRFLKKFSKLFFYKMLLDLEVMRMHGL